MIKIGIFGTIIIAALLAWFVVIPNFMQGTAVWCEYMDTKDKADWSASDAATYLKECAFRD